MTTVTLAVRNFLGGGLKAWLRVLVLSLSFVVIIGMQGLLDGVNEQASQAMISAELGGGQYWHQRYDPQNLLDLPDAHGQVPAELQRLIDRGQATAVLIVQGFMYSGGSFRPVLLKGIDPAQLVLSLPSSTLAATGAVDPALIGTRTARDAGLKPGDTATVRWRDGSGTFDAKEIRIAHIMSTTVQTVDSGQVWLPLDALRQMARMPNEASLVVLARHAVPPAAAAGWTHRDHDYLLADLRALVRTKMVGSTLAYLMLLFLAMITILDTQVLSIFHRKKEIGTLMALGLTRGAVIRLFTLEGALNALSAALLGAVYGIPLLVWFVKTGLAVPAAMESSGFSIGERIYPAYSAVLVVGTMVLVSIVTTIVSYLPTRQIARLKPADALRGRLA